MRFSPMSFALGIAAAAIVPLLSRVARPLAVEAAAAGLAMADGAQRFVAEQAETLEDIWAEARTRYEQHADEALGGAVAAAAMNHSDEAPAEAGRARRRSNGSGRRRAP